MKSLHQTSSWKPKNKCSIYFFMKIETNSHVNQGDTVYFTQSFSNRKICCPSLVSNQIHNNFYFHEVSLQNDFKICIWKNKRLKGRLPKCKKYSGMCNQHVSRTNNPLEDISVILFLTKPQYKSLRILIEIVLAVSN